MTAQLALPLGFGPENPYRGLDPEVEAAIERECAEWRRLSTRASAERCAIARGERLVWSTLLCDRETAG